MPRKEKKFHFMYKTTNKVTGKYYYGIHSTNDLDDGYLGSGKRLRYSINKYGEENHQREILEYCNSREDLKKREFEIVNLNEIAKEGCMNLQTGGGGGFLNIEHAKKAQKSGAQTTNNKLWKDSKHIEFMSNLLKERWKDLEYREKILKSINWTGKNHSEESKAKMRKSKNIGKDNSQFRTCWITNEIENKKIKKDNLIPDGWRLGRKLR